MTNTCPGAQWVSALPRHLRRNKTRTEAGAARAAHVVQRLCFAADIKQLYAQRQAARHRLACAPAQLAVCNMQQTEACAQPMKLERAGSGGAQPAHDRASHPRNTICS